MFNMITSDIKQKAIDINNVLLKHNFRTDALNQLSMLLKTNNIKDTKDIVEVCRIAGFVRMVETYGAKQFEVSYRYKMHGMFITNGKNKFDYGVMIL